MTHEGCGGTWEPCPGWSARYRCAKCWSLGMKERLTSGGARGKETIRPYLCTRRMKGKPCGRAATRREDRKCYCAEHAP
jgi:hypothetical protein